MNRRYPSYNENARCIASFQRESEHDSSLIIQVIKYLLICCDITQIFNQQNPDIMSIRKIDELAQNIMQFVVYQVFYQ